MLPLISAASVALTMCYIFYVKKYKNILTNFYYRAIGHASINGIDAPVRVRTFWLSLIILIVSFFVINYFFTRVKRRLSSRLDAGFLSLESTMFFELGMLILVNLVVFYNNVLRYQPDAARLKILVLLAFTTAIVGLHTFIKILDAKNSSQQNALGAALSFLFPIPLTYFVLLMTYFNTPTVPVYTLKALFVYLFLFFIVRFLIRGILKPVPTAYSLIPVMFIPFAYIAGNELQYTLTKYGMSFPPKIIAAAFSAVLLIIGVLVYINKRNVTTEDHIIPKIENIIVPVLLVTLGLFACHAQEIEPNFDLLHYGNRTLPAQQLYQFGKLPVLEILPHIQWPIGAFVYMLINGNNLLEPTIWNDLSYIIIVVLIAYFVLRQFLSARWTALLLCFSPILAYSNTYYITGLLPLVYLKKMREKRSFKHYLIFLFLSLIAFAYQPSTGKIAVLSCIVILCFSCSNKNEITQAIKAFMTVFITPVVIGFAILVIKGENIADWMILLMSANKSDILIGSYTTFIANHRTAFEVILYYGLFPLMCVVFAILALRQKEKSNLTFCYIYISVASIVCSLRAFARHSQAEGLPIDFFILLFMLVPCVFIANKVYKKITFVLIMFIFMLVPYYINKPIREPPADPLAAVGVKDFSFRRFKIGEVRCDTANSASYPNNLRKVLDTVLENDQTFFDGINTYLLYSLMERECTFMPYSTLLIQYEAPQEAYIRKLNKLYEQSKVPVVIYGASNWYGSAIDDIPSELSLFKLSEFIYTHYEPWIWVDGFHLWKARNSDLELLETSGGAVVDTIDPPNDAAFEIKSINIIESALPCVYTDKNSIKQDFNMIMLPYVWGNFDKKVNKHFPEEQQRIADNLPLEARKTVTLELDSSFDKSVGNYIYFLISATNPGTMTLRYGNDIINSCNFNIVEGEHNYLVRISSQYNWMAKPQTSIEIKSDIPVSIQRVSILKGD
jgi:hypothetical protein